MRIAILCNDRLGIPALQQLVQSGLVKAAATSDRSPEMMMVMQQMSKQANVPSQIFTRKNFESALLSWLDQHKPDVVFVKTFPFRIPASALAIPRHGFINFHYAPLPQFRGSNPLFWMIRNRAPSAGISVHRMDENYDTGPLLVRHDFPLHPGITFGMLCSQLAMEGVGLTAKVVNGLVSGSLQSQIQNENDAASWGRPVADDLRINWKKMSQAEVLALIRACNPWNRGAAVHYRGWMFAVSDATESDKTAAAGTTPGTIIAIAPGQGMHIVCADAKMICAEVVYTEEGFFEAGRLIQFGLQPGTILDSN